MLQQFFILAAVCYAIYIISNQLDLVGGRLGNYLNLSDEVVASTFQALATSGPEILMAIIVATPFISQSIWVDLSLAERACSGTLNMAFSAMDNLLGIGAVAIVFMLITKKVDPNEIIESDINTIFSLAFYTLISLVFVIFCFDYKLTYIESWILMILGIVFVVIEVVIKRKEAQDVTERKETVIKRMKGTAWNGLQYSFLIFALIVFVKIAMSASFNLALLGSISIGSIVLLFTSYISSFPEFVFSFKYAIEGRKKALLGILFGSNIIDLAFAGFRSIWLHEEMLICTTGKFPKLLFLYLSIIPIIACIMLISISSKFLKWKHAYVGIVIYLIYIISGFILL